MLNVKDYGALGDGTTLDTTAVNNAISALPATGGTVYFPQGKYKLGATPITKPNVTFMGDGAGATTIWHSSIGANTNAISVTANGFAAKGITFEGPSTIYVLNETCISFTGSNTSSRRVGLTVKDCEFTKYGGYCVFGKFATNVLIENNFIHDTGGAGILFMSSDNGAYLHNRVKTISLDNGSNAYGLGLTHDSLGYNADPYASSNGRLTANPFCRGWNVSFNEVEDIAWEGIDCHGGYEVQIIGNRVYNTKHGISAPSSSGDAYEYAGEQNIVADNIIDGRKKDGTTSGREGTGYGINMNSTAGTVVNNRRVMCHNNIIRHKGEAGHETTGAILCYYTQYALISDNLIDHWYSNAIVTGSGDIAIKGNHFGGMAAASQTSGACVRVVSGTSKEVTIIGNDHSYTGGYQATYGVKVSGLTTPKLFADANNFKQTATVLGTDSAYTWLRSDLGASEPVDDEPPSGDTEIIYTANITTGTWGAAANLTLRCVFQAGGGAGTISIPTINPVKFRLKLKGNPSEACDVQNVYFGQQASSGNAYNFAAGKGQVKVGGSGTFTIPAGSEVQTDWITASWNKASNLTLSLQTTTNSAADMVASISTANASTYYKVGADTADTTSGYSSAYSHAVFITEIECSE